MLARESMQRERHTHGKRLACFRPRQRFQYVAADESESSSDERFEHVEHADARAQRSLDNGDGHDRSSSTASPPPTPNKHLNTYHPPPVATCDCEFQVFRCQLVHADDSWAVREERYLSRVAKWTERFFAHDWRHARVCQKWLENQHKFELEALGEDASTTPAPRNGGVKHAFSSIASAAEGLFLPRQFDALLRAGVPPQLRGRVWWMCSGAASKRASATESYAALVARLHTLSDAASLEIEKDLPRTFPIERTSASSESDERHRRRSTAELRRVLQAYSIRNPAIGYCQSMNFLAAVLLHHMAEEEAFWVLTTIVEDLTPQYHTRSMAGSRADQRVFADLVQQKLPTLFAHMRALGVDFEPFTLKWFLCLFLHTLPFEPVLRLWDVFFCEGSHVLLRVGLVLLKLNEPRILACDDAFDVYEMFKVSHATLADLTAPHRSGLLNRDECVCDTLVRLVMDKTFVGPIPFDSLHALRLCYRNDIEAEVAAIDARRRAARASQPPLQQRNDSAAASEAHELLEYDFVDEFGADDVDVRGDDDDDDDVLPQSPFVRFRDVYDSEDSSASDYFIDVQYECAVQQRCR